MKALINAGVKTRKHRSEGLVIGKVRYGHDRPGVKVSCHEKDVFQHFVLIHCNTPLGAVQGSSRDVPALLFHEIKKLHSGALEKLSARKDLLSGIVIKPSDAAVLHGKRKMQFIGTEKAGASLHTHLFSACKGLPETGQIHRKPRPLRHECILTRLNALPGLQDFVQVECPQAFIKTAGIKGFIRKFFPKERQTGISGSFFQDRFSLFPQHFFLLSKRDKVRFFPAPPFFQHTMHLPGNRIHPPFYILCPPAFRKSFLCFSVKDIFAVLTVLEALLF